MKVQCFYFSVRVIDRMTEKELSSSWETVVADTENEVNGVSVSVDVSQLETIDQEGKKVKDVS